MCVCVCVCVCACVRACVCVLSEDSVNFNYVNYRIWDNRVKSHLVTVIVEKVYSSFVDCQLWWSKNFVLSTAVSELHQMT